jgi:hypothetical protein
MNVMEVYEDFEIIFAKQHLLWDAYDE